MSRRINPYKMFHGSFIPEWLEERPISEISIGAKLIYARLCRYSGKKGDCKPKVESIAKTTGIGKRQVEKYIAELKKLKLIEAVRVGRKCANRYFFLEHKWFSEALYGNCDANDSAYN
jgi:DNA-binding transcriptional ArsR family regulator